MLPIFEYRIKLLINIYCFIFSYLCFIHIFPVTEQYEQSNDEVYIGRMFIVLYGNILRNTNLPCQCICCAKLHLLKKINIKLKRYLSSSLIGSFRNVSEIIEDYKLDLLLQKYRRLLTENNFLINHDVRSHVSYDTPEGKRVTGIELCEELESEAAHYITSIKTLTNNCQTWFKADFRNGGKYVKKTFTLIDDVETIMHNYDPVDLFNEVNVILEKYYTLQGHRNTMKMCLRHVADFEIHCNYGFFGLGQNSVSSEFGLMEKIRVTRQKVFYLTELTTLLLLKTECLFRAKTNTDMTSYLRNRPQLRLRLESKAKATPVSSAEYKLNFNWARISVVFGPCVILLLISFLLAYSLQYEITDDSFCKLKLTPWF